MKTQRKRTQQEAMCIQFTRHKYIEHVPNKPTTTSRRKKGIDKYANAQTIMCAEGTSNNVCRTHKQQCGRDRVLEKARI